MRQFTTGFDEYEAIFIYLSDVLMLGFLAGFFREFKATPYGLISAGGGQARLPALGGNGGITKSLAVFLALAGFSVLTAFSKPVAIYNFIRLILLAVTALAVAKMLRLGLVKFENILAVLAGSAVVQSLIGIGQFVQQAGLGLGRLGEPLIGPNIGGAAKIIAEGGKVLRAYGTLPHPNVLAAFLIIGLLAMYHFWLRRPSEWKFFSGFRTLASDALLGTGIFVIVLGLTFAFSRAAWVVATAASLTIISYSLLSRINWIQAVRLSILLFAIVVILFTGFKDFILPRAQVSPSEPAVTQRLSYNQLALNIIQNNFLGVGIGNQVLYSVKNEVYKRAGMNQVWQWQPIHNLYLLIASEVGVAGLLAWLVFLCGILISNFKFLISKKVLNSNSQLEISNSLLVIPTIMLLALLLLGLFDHFLWTLQPGRLILWLTIGLVMGLTKANERS